MVVIFNLLNKTILVALIVTTIGCTIKTQITEPDGSIYIIESKSDSLVSMKKDGRIITVDNRGKPNIFESLLGWMLLKTPEINQVK